MFSLKTHSFLPAALLLPLLLSSCKGRTASGATSWGLFQRKDTVKVLSAPAPDYSVLEEWKAGEYVDSSLVYAYGIGKCFSSDTISDGVFSRMKGKSYPEGCPVKREDLRYIKVLHKDIVGRIRLGEMVCNKAIASDLVEIFRELFEKGYPIEKMVLIDEYGASDEESMRDNNSSAFCYRVVSGSRMLSKHALGMAVDINTLYNPYVRPLGNGNSFIQPSTAGPYVDRMGDFPYKITPNDEACKAFLKRGFSWGGAWPYPKDYQHFEKAL